MFSRVATFTLAALPLLAAATALEARDGGSSCSTGPIQCCNTVEHAYEQPAASIIAGLGIVLQDPTVLVGLTCTPITAIGVGGSGTCNANTVCCQDNSYGSLISIGCVPVIL